MARTKGKDKEMSRCTTILVICMSMVRLAAAASQACISPNVSDVCRCSDTTVECDSRNLTEVPNDIPVSTTELRLQQNQITAITSQTFGVLRNLQRLYFNNNNISVVEPGSFQYMQELIELNLAHNKLTSLHKDTFATLHKLDVLDLSNNNIVTLDHVIINGFNQLSTLDVSYNSMTGMPSSVADLRDLRYFKAQHNEITDIQPGLFSNANLVVNLDISYNNISMIQEGTFAHMTISNAFKLSLEGNPIKQLDKYSFSNIVSLDVIIYWFEMNFASMQLEKIHELAFHNMLNRRKGCSTCGFIFNGNFLETIPSNLCDLFGRYNEYQVYLYLDNNPWSCDCRMREVLNCSRLIRHYNDFTCQSPPALNNRRLPSLNPEDLVCSSPAIDYISPTVHQAVVGENVTLYCNATGFNRPTLTWTLPQVSPSGTPTDRQHHEVSTAKLDYDSAESILTITHVQMSDQGNYTCQASNAAGVDSRSLSLTVKVFDSGDVDDTDFQGQGPSHVAAAIGGTVGAVVLCTILGLIYFMHKQRQNKNNSSNRPSTQTTQQSTKHSNPEFEEDDAEYDDVRVAEPSGRLTIEIQHGRSDSGRAGGFLDDGTTAIQGAESGEGGDHLYQGLVHETLDHVYTSPQDTAPGGHDERTVGDGGRSGQDQRPRQEHEAPASQTTSGSGEGARGHQYQSLRLETPGHVYTSLRGEEATSGDQDAYGRQSIDRDDHEYDYSEGGIVAPGQDVESYEEPSPQYYNIPEYDYHDYLSLGDD